MAERVALIDYGAGNLRSVENALKAAGAADVLVTADPDVVRGADRIVLPGVGAFGACMRALKEHRFDQLVKERASEGTPLLGVCVGMQLLFDESVEFGSTRGLGLLRGSVRRFNGELVVPHGSVGYQTIFAAGLTLLLFTLGCNIAGHVLRKRFRESY